MSRFPDPRIICLCLGLAGLVSGASFAAVPGHGPLKAAHHQAGTPAVAPVADYALDANIAKWYTDHGATLPVTDTPVYCHGYGCEFQTPVPIDAAGLQSLERLFVHDATAADERRAISEAVRWWERRASPLLGGPPRKHGSDIGHAHHLGATDCIDEATNTTSILVFLERHGLLRHHVVAPPASRGFIVNAHSTAVLREKGGDVWVVDMWMHDMGEAPDIMKEAQWFAEA